MIKSIINALGKLLRAFIMYEFFAGDKGKYNFLWVCEYFNNIIRNLTMKF